MLVTKTYEMDNFRTDNAYDGVFWGGGGAGGCVSQVSEASEQEFGGFGVGQWPVGFWVSLNMRFYWAPFASVPDVPSPTIFVRTLVLIGVRVTEMVEPARSYDPL